MDTSEPTTTPAPTSQASLETAHPQPDPSTLQPHELTSSASSSSQSQDKVMDTSPLTCQPIVDPQEAVAPSSDAQSSEPGSKKKKKKPPNSAESQSEGVDAEANVSESLQSLSLGEGAAACASETPEGKPEEKKKRKRRRRKIKVVVDVEGERNVEMGEGMSAEAGTSQLSLGSVDALQALVTPGNSLPVNLQRLHLHLSKKKREKAEQQKRQHLEQLKHSASLPNAALLRPGLLGHPQGLLGPGILGPGILGPRPGQFLHPQHPHYSHSCHVPVHMLHNRFSYTHLHQLHHLPLTTPPLPQHNNLPSCHAQSAHGQHQRQHQHQHQQKGPSTPKSGKKKNVFESYWPIEQVTEGLENGVLIEGRLRINPKNYEDAYVPLPDGTSDVYISGMSARNRALNGDTVAVLIQDRDNWRVYTNEVSHYEKQNMPGTSFEHQPHAENQEDTDNIDTKKDIEEVTTKEKAEKKAEKDDNKEEKAEKEEETDERKEENSESNADTLPQPMETEESEKERKAKNENAEDGKKKEDEEDEKADVAVEEEEEVEMDETGKPIGSTKIMKPACASSSKDPTPPQSPAVPQGHQTPQGSGKAKDGKKGDKTGTPKSGKKGAHCGTPNSKHKRYTSLKDMKDQGSPVARKLFGAQEKEEEEDGDRVNMDRFLQRTGKVVAILEQKHSRACSGSLKPMQDVSYNFATFAPTDPRVPRIMIPTSELPQGFKERPADFANVLFIANITAWWDHSKMPKGSLARSLGEAGCVETETEALLIENDVDSSEFSEEVLACLPQQTPWTIPAEELAARRDLRQECVFTIDPATARDLDDALHCRDLGDGVYEVGVHIADVSYFVKEKTKLDEVASSRATSVYLVQQVIPMLPRLLCEQLCSLNPDEDRLSFSVIWKITEDGVILEEWFGRTVIRSCVKLSYDHAQGFIEEPDREWTPEELPPISPGFAVNDIKTRVLTMNKMAQAMRKARFDSGALRLDQLKIQFTLDQESGLPNGYFVYQQRDSNKLVEEFMLLANMAVAHKIRQAHKDKAVLRRHPPPQTRMIDELKELCASLNIPMKMDSAREIQKSLARYDGTTELAKARLQVLVVMCSKPMQNARYFCCGLLADEKLYHHYALNVPLYTHFTSPIRRYPDILVHRTLAAALGYCNVTSRSSQELHKIATHCNDKKSNAKICSDRSNELYFSVFVKEAGPLEADAMVMAVLDKSFDIYVLTLGVVKRVYCEKLPLEKFSFHKEGKRPELTMVWKPDDGCRITVTQKISIFSTVKCTLKSEPGPLRWSASIRRPLEGDASIVS